MGTSFAMVVSGGGPPADLAEQCRGKMLAIAVSGVLPGPPHFLRSKRSISLHENETGTDACAESKMNEISLLNRANLFETGLFSWGIPEQTAKELTRHHTELCYESGRLVFSQGSPADIVLWVVKGVVREVCPNSNGTQTLVRLATAGDILGLADKLDEKGQWIRRFEAWTASKCVLAIVTRQHVRDSLKWMNPDDLLALVERMHSASSEWVQYYAAFLGLSFRKRIEIVLAELGRKFGIPDSDGVLLTFEPTQSDLAEMIGSSRPAVGRILTELLEDGEVGRRDRKYILLRGGAIEAAVSEGTHVAKANLRPNLRPVTELLNRR
jgi:CRP/FNR family transcriptional regulator, cyclic AMP receptor protein